MPDDRFLHASRRRERQARSTVIACSPLPNQNWGHGWLVTLITAVVATRWICADLAWPIQAASVVGFAVLFTGIAELVRGES